MGKLFILILVAILQDIAATGSQKKIVQISLKEIVQISLKEICSDFFEKSCSDFFE